MLNCVDIRQALRCRLDVERAGTQKQISTLDVSLPTFWFRFQPLLLYPSSGRISSFIYRFVNSVTHSFGFPFATSALSTRYRAGEGRVVSAHCQSQTSMPTWLSVPTLQHKLSPLSCAMIFDDVLRRYQRRLWWLIFGALRNIESPR